MMKMEIAAQPSNEPCECCGARSAMSCSCVYCDECGEEFNDCDCGGYLVYWCGICGGDAKGDYWDSRVGEYYCLECLEKWVPYNEID